MFVLHKTESKVEICVWDFIGGGTLTPVWGWGWGFGSRKQNHGALWQRHLFLISDDPLLSMMGSLFTVEYDFNCGLLVSGLYYAQAYSFNTHFFWEFSSWEKVEFFCCLFASREVIVILSFILSLRCALDWFAPARWAILVPCTAIELECGMWLFSVLLNAVC